MAQELRKCVTIQGDLKGTASEPKLLIHDNGHNRNTRTDREPPTVQTYKRKCGADESESTILKERVIKCAHLFAITVSESDEA